MLRWQNITPAVNDMFPESSVYKLMMQFLNTIKKKERKDTKAAENLSRSD